MLVLMRKPGEAIHIGRRIVVTLISLERNRARIGIDAPRDVIVDREEIALKKREEVEAMQGAEQPLQAAEEQIEVK